MVLGAFIKTSLQFEKLGPFVWIDIIDKDAAATKGFCNCTNCGPTSRLSKSKGPPSFLVQPQFLAQNFEWFFFVAVNTSKTNDGCRGEGEI